MSAMMNDTPTSEAAWARACILPDFTYAELADQIKCAPEQVGEAVRLWVRRGWAEQIDDKTAHGRFRVLPEQRPAPEETGSPTAKMWKAMCKLKSFTAVEISAYASGTGATVTVEDARAYIGVLFRHGYLRCTRKADPSKDRLASYKVIRNTGPKAPELKRIRVVYDPNVDAYHTPEGKL